MDSSLVPEIGLGRDRQTRAGEPRGGNTTIRGPVFTPNTKLVVRMWTKYGRLNRQGVATHGSGHGVPIYAKYEISDPYID